MCINIFITTDPPHRSQSPDEKAYPPSGVLALIGKGPKSKGASKLHLQLAEVQKTGTNTPPKHAATTQPPTPSPTFSFMAPLPIMGDSHSSQNRHGTGRRP